MTLWLGQLAALSAALCWALATLLYSKSSLHLSSAQLNLVKGLFATPMLFLGLGLSSDVYALSWQTWPVFVLILSGIIGITIGDTCYFSALRRLGPSHTILLEYLAPPFAAVIAWLVLSETLTWTQIAAGTLVILGVLSVLTEKQPIASPLRSRSGLWFGVAAALCQAVGLVMAFQAFQQFDMNAMQAAMIRLGAGTVVLTFALVVIRPRMLVETKRALLQTNIPVLLLAIALGTFLAIWLQQLAISVVSPGIAQTLLSTAPLFMLSISIIRGRSVSVRAFTGTLIAMLGITGLFAFTA